MTVYLNGICFITDKSSCGRVLYKTVFSVIPSHYDSLVAKLIVHGRDRAEAISKMKRALDEFIIERIKTTIPFHKKVLSDPDLYNGTFTTAFVEKFNAARVPVSK